jgi:hypothetical protein
MSEHLRAGILALELYNLLNRELLMHMARAVPQQHLAVRHGIETAARFRLEFH